MKYTFTLIAVLCSIAISQAQWKVGPVASVGVVTQQSAAIPVMPMSDYLTYEMEYKGGTQVKSVGLMAFNNLGPVFLQTGILATSYELEFTIASYKSLANPETYMEKFYMVEVPFAAGVNIKNFKLGLGPVFEFNVDKESQLAEMENYVDNSKTMDFGFHGLLGFRKGILHVDMKYVYKFSSLVDDFSFGYDEFMYHKSANRLTLSVGMAF